MKDLSGQIIAAAIEIHRTLGPGLHKDAYVECLAKEFELRNLRYRRHIPLPIEYKGVSIASDYHMDLVVHDAVVLEIVTSDIILPAHHASLLSHLKLSQISLGLLINFRASLLKNGIKRVVNNYVDSLQLQEN